MMNRAPADRAPSGEQGSTLPTPFGWMMGGVRASRVTQEATQDLTLETLARSQRFWWDH